MSSEDISKQITVWQLIDWNVVLPGYRMWLEWTIISLYNTHQGIHLEECTCPYAPHMWYFHSYSRENRLMDKLGFDPSTFHRIPCILWVSDPLLDILCGWEFEEHCFILRESCQKFAYICTQISVTWLKWTTILSLFTLCLDKAYQGIHLEGCTCPYAPRMWNSHSYSQVNRLMDKLGLDSNTFHHSLCILCSPDLQSDILCGPELKMWKESL